MKYIIFPATLIASFLGSVATANAFEVYCVPSLDGISTCTGWKQDQKLDCISSPGGVASCSASDGEKFTCTQDASGVTTCGDIQFDPGKTHQNCTAIGDGSFSCQDSESLTQSTQQSSSVELNAVSDVIGDSAQSLIDNNATENLESLDPLNSTNIPLLKP